MNRKGSKEYLSQANRPKRRRFHGNQYTVEKDVDISSTSGQKLQRKENLDVIVSSAHGYRVLNSFAVFSTILRLWRPAKIVTVRLCVFTSGKAWTWFQNCNTVQVWSTACQLVSDYRKNIRSKSKNCTRHATAGY